MPKRIFTEEEKQKIIYYYTVEKMGAKPLGAKFNCSAPTLLKNLAEWGIQPNSKKLDLTNKKFGKLTVIKPAPRRNDKYTRWICKCKCGKQVEVRTDYLTSFHTISCGCEKEKHFGKTVVLNQKYGKLTPIKYDNIKQQYFCKCDCGNTTYVIGYNLTNGNTQSCGCLKSKGELKINNLLNMMNINFETQYTFDNCRFPDTGRLAYFDYAIFNEDNSLKMLIEYDGSQHQYGWGQKKESLQQIEKRDLFKEEYCILNNIPLIRISYVDYEKLDEEYLNQIINKIIVKQVENE